MQSPITSGLDTRSGVDEVMETLGARLAQWPEPRYRVIFAAACTAAMTRGKRVTSGQPIRLVNVMSKA